MKYHNIGFDLKMKVRNYLEYIWQEESLQNLKETNEVINKLSHSLKNELLLHANGVVLRDIPMLNNNFSAYSMRKIAIP